MSSITRSRPPTQFQFRIIQQEFDRHHKRRLPEHNNGSEDDDDYDDDCGDGSQPPSKTRKKPGRKPNPASPAVRKEQNRAAQRAFRDRKERHLQQLENMIKDLKEAHFQATLCAQREAQQLKGTIEALKSENFYLREVVFSFESALSKNGNVQILQDVKAELYRRHYEKHSAKKLSEITASSKQHPQQQQQQQQSRQSTITAALPVAVTTYVAPRVPVAQTRDEILTQAMAAATAAITSSHRTSKSSSKESKTSFSSSKEFKISSPSSSSSSPATPVTHSPTVHVIHTTTSSKTRPVNNTFSSTAAPQNSWSTFRAREAEEDPVFMGDSEILYRAPPLFATMDEENGRLEAPTSSTQPLSVPRPSYQRPGTLLSKFTEYTKHPTVYDELQSSLFPPGTLQSIVHGNMPTPQEIVNDMSLFEQLHDRTMQDPVISSGPSIFSLSTASVNSSAFGTDSTSFMDSEDGDDYQQLSTSTLGFDDGLKQPIIPSHRLQLEIRVLASAPPVADPNIDPKIYELPHDSRIDLIPCPKLRAQMIVHQGDYDIEELCELLIARAICHGHPLDPHSWELPEAFFDKFGYLLGQEMMRHRNKLWPKKEEELQFDTSRVH
ncbi:hypothetical protein BG004_001911 [Podila humilis]|nr:hypothetical protein BG004_001911 [Podila humilis]